MYTVAPTITVWKEGNLTGVTKGFLQKLEELHSSMGGESHKNDVKKRSDKLKNILGGSECVSVVCRVFWGKATWETSTPLLTTWKYLN